MSAREFRAARETLDMTQTEMAATLGLSIAAVCRAEANGLSRGSAPTLVRLLVLRPELVPLSRAVSGVPIKGP